MARITFKDDTFETVGDLPAKGSVAFPFALTKTELTECILEDFKGKRVVLNMFPSIDTSVCAASVRRFNQEASELENCAVLCISADLPFAHNRFCEAEGLKDVIPLSVFRVTRVWKRLRRYHNKRSFERASGKGDSYC